MLSNTHHIQEATRLRNAFKEPEFRKLFFDYAKEISDPENKKVSAYAYGVRLMTLTLLFHLYREMRKN